MVFCFVCSVLGFFACFVLFFETGFLCVASFGCPGTHSVDQTGLELTEICLTLSASAEIKDVPPPSYNDFLKVPLRAYMREC